MPATQAKYGQGSLLKMGDLATPANYATVLEVTTFQLPQENVASVAATSHSSPNSTDEYIPGMIAPGTMTFSAHWLPKDPSQDANVGYSAAFHARSVRPWQALLPLGYATIAFAAFATQYHPDAPSTGLLVLAGQLQVSGAVTTT